jgi:hypothetical protein
VIGGAALAQSDIVVEIVAVAALPDQIRSAADRSFWRCH